MSGYSSSDSDEEEQHSGDDAPYANAQRGLVFPLTNLPADTISGLIITKKSRIATLLKQIEPDITITKSNIDAVIAQKMTENGIEFNPNDPNQQTQLQQLTTLLTKLEEKLQKKGGKRQKSKRYRKSKKQRKTKTKRRLRRSYKYKYK
jgi:hypothetical protein